MTRPMREAAVAAVMVLGPLTLASGAAWADAAAGRTKAEACEPCHGLDGVSQLPEAPHLAGQREEYLKAQLAAFRGGQRQNEQMSPMAQDLSDEDIADLAAWYGSIKVTVTPPPAE